MTAETAPGWDFNDTINMVKCPKCHAKVGLDCRNSKGIPITPPHDERAEAVIRKFGGESEKAAHPKHTFGEGKLLFNNVSMDIGKLTDITFDYGSHPDKSVYALGQKFYSSKYIPPGVVYISTAEMDKDALDKIKKALDDMEKKITIDSWPPYDGDSHS